MVQINSMFIADLKRLADLKRKMDEFDELGKGLKKKTGSSISFFGLKSK
ncbi:hypothetical protein OQX61_09950 [Pedobacter sp. PLR]|nr:hypothetical protein [Pedobacter sp. PLR]MCX2451584.1 hypothetical protein [Pedobacter sp. PLR]